MKSTLILTAISLLTAAAHGSVVKVQSTGRVTGSVQNPSGTVSVSFSASCASSTPGCDNNVSGSASTPTIISSIASVPARLSLNGVHRA
ncbi:hypothetical protein EDB89DRAFT_2080823 [Lactarius sanguifluus]|nr:hypothetical protein EDB89DRAFT_2080823 [Lactarius sanguifluus]